MRNVYIFQLTDSTLNSAFPTRQTQLNASVDTEAYRTEHRSPYDYANLLEQHFLELGQASGLVERHELGLVRVDVRPLREQLQPSPQRVIDALTAGMPAIARSQLDALSDEVAQALHQFDAQPETTEEFVFWSVSRQFCDDFVHRI